MCVCARARARGGSSFVYLLFPFFTTSQFNLGYVFKDHQQKIIAIARRLKPSVIEWNKNFSKGPNGRGATEWKQSMKNNFVHLTQLDTNNPAIQKNKWREDLATAAAQTVDKLCQDWETNKAHKGIYESIQREKKRKGSPRCPWLREKAHAWLQSVPPEAREESWYPKHAIQVAHQIFLNRSGIKECFKAFVGYLDKRTAGKETLIADLLKKHKAAMGLY